ncbi:unnamed protein product, partial [Nesidiocoris tenuis]
MITSAPILKTPDFQTRFQLYTDASTVGVAACLAQSVDDKIHPVAFASRKLNSAERNYSAYEIEMLAVIFAVNKFRVYLENTEFDLHTDHKALTTLTKMKQEKGRLIRWQLELMPFRYQAHHISGNNNSLADYLSRNPADQSGSTTSSVCLNIILPELFSNISEEQEKDEKLGPLILKLRQG